ncbi:amino acid ABC transporter permease [Frigidibacter sp. MR17.24]|uniref:amino acid ABC transporter permease n=1 Tax=Frigidibacter sp. MR17.24 TaxID=3127345 RepID=UPI0030131B4F
MGFGTIFFNPDVIAQYLPAILGALWVTVWLSVVITATGLVLGAALAALRTTGLRVLAWPVILFADLLRALPPLVLILILYFGLPSLGLTLPALAVLWIVLSLVLAAFAEEIFWAGITALPRGQWEAGAATGLGRPAVLAHIIFPQALRMGIPSLVNRALTISKTTALGSVIGVKEVVSVAGSAQSTSGSATPLTMAALAYLVILVPAMIASRRIERRFAYQP